MPDAENVPLCPITGQPAARRVQWLYSTMLMPLWRWGGGVDIARLLAGIERFPAASRPSPSFGGIERHSEAGVRSFRRGSSERVILV